MKVRRKFDERTAEDEDESDRYIEARDLKILVLNLYFAFMGFLLDLSKARDFFLIFFISFKNCLEVN